MHPEPTRRDMTRSPVADDLDDRLTYTLTEVAQRLGISRALAYRAANRGELPICRIGRRMVVPRAAFLRLLAQEQKPEQAS